MTSIFAKKTKEPLSLLREQRKKDYAKIERGK
jgi:hypothetical protein